MATRAKYYRVKQEDNKEDKPDTDILMRFNPTYGTCPPTQAAMLPAHWPSFSARERILWLSRLLIALWRGLYGLQKLLKEGSKDYIKLLKSKKEKWWMFMSPEKKVWSEFKRRDILLLWRSLWQRHPLHNRKNLLAISNPKNSRMPSIWQRRNGRHKRLKGRKRREIGKPENRIVVIIEEMREEEEEDDKLVLYIGDWIKNECS